MKDFFFFQERVICTKCFVIGELSCDSDNWRNIRRVYN